MNPTLIASTEGNEVVFCSGFDDVPKHHIVVKHKSVTRSYPGQVRDQVSLRVHTKKVNCRMDYITDQQELFDDLRVVYTLLMAANFLDVLLEIQEDG